MRRRLFLICLCFGFVAANGATAEYVRRAQFIYGSEYGCRSAGKLSAEQCANAAANTQAEFDEKAPRFPSREACERLFRGAGCSVGFKGADGWAGKRSGVYFQPRQAGFHVNVVSEREMTATPQVLGPSIGFSPRTILRKDTRIDQRFARSRELWRPRAAGAGAAFGVATPDGAAGPLPPPPPVDPNFDCAAVLEPSAKDGAATGCYLAPARRR